MSENDLFKDKPIEAGVTEDPTDNEGDRGKIDPDIQKWLEKDHTVVAEAKVNSDRFIKQLQTELDGLRQELNTRISLEEFMDKQKEVDRQRTQRSSERTGDELPYESQYDREGAEQEKTKQPGTEVDLTDTVNKTVEQVLSQREVERQVQSNLEFVKAEATKHLGPEFPYLFEKKASEMGMSKAILEDLAMKEPKAFLQLMLGQDYSPATSSSPPRGSVSSEAQISQSERRPGKGTRFSDWNEIRKSDPAAYWSPKVQNEIFNAAREAEKRGEDFYS